MNEQNQMTVCGVMSGTSLDGVDVAIVHFENIEDDLQFELKYFTTIPYTHDLQKRLQSIVQLTSQSPDISSMNMLLGETYAKAVNQAIEQSGLEKHQIDLISSHGQTIFHNPTPTQQDPLHRPNTLQIGDISVIAELTGIPTIGDFRTRDMAVGGQGAPLVPYADYELFRSQDVGRILVNIGGISNMTLLKKGCHADEVIAYDTGPGNMLIDAFVTWHSKGEMTFDEDGQLASQGQVNHQWLNELLKHPYFSERPPKSTGREQFGIDYAKTLWQQAKAKNISELDRIATITDLTAHTLADSLNQHINEDDIKEIYISGGGFRNQYLMARLKEALPEHINLQSTQTLGIDQDAKEAIVFALLGYLGFNRKTNNLPSATGARKSVVMGKISW
ncbi:anhydro-N-acetylmuramic acid kinase [Tenuibacillus multivorans]|uniref:Anhydro-N-acetylmuramic acid kinase n=1 Tax=Tenuibacillus multivorans TaxID=237069 RepID=A0A1H0C4I3_9BACI|nr:anhydro-N-acetylmuramic acid kinase [Tenuibacillus multivorans]GEL77762.1 anhydro-N-acetylmuramic acid kinase [Tenuibacillus multivorans]SDN52762.1 anhydro-N-acetylmuramic acid kinase [Tenuibacillus multivorans]